VIGGSKLILASHQVTEKSQVDGLENELNDGESGKLSPKYLLIPSEEQLIKRDLAAQKLGDNNHTFHTLWSQAARIRVTLHM
jgi:hypothetical protein